MSDSGAWSHGDSRSANSGDIPIRGSRTYYGVLLLACAGFVVSGIYLIYRDNAAIGWVTTAFFGAGGLVILWQFMDRRPRLVINDIGIRDRALGVGVIPWQEIRSAYVRSISDVDFVCLELWNPERFASRLGRVQKAMQTANRKLGFTDFSICLRGLTVRPETLLELIAKKSAEAEVGTAP